MNIQNNVPLAPYSTFKIGGPAEHFIEVKAKEDLIEAIKWAHDNNKKIHILGGGSNLLINDAGVKGLVIKLANEEVKIGDEMMLCGAGLKLNKALKEAALNNLSGLEWVAGIPGATVGGAIRGNAEALSSPISKIVESVEVYDVKLEKFKTMSKEECCFEYRESIFKRNDQLIVWQAALKMEKTGQEEIKEKMLANLKFRKGSNPPEPSAGSIFKNVPLKMIEENNKELAEKVKELGIARLGNVGAGLIIDKILSLKGKQIGGAKISELHANFIVNIGDASAEDVATLISYIKQQCRDKLGIQLQEEIQYFGY